MTDDNCGILVATASAPVPRKTYSTPYHLLLMRAILGIFIYYTLFLKHPSVEDDMKGDPNLVARSLVFLVYLADAVGMIALFRYKVTNGEAVKPFGFNKFTTSLLAWRSVSGVAGLLLVAKLYRHHTSCIVAFLMAGAIDATTIVQHNTAHEDEEESREQILKKGLPKLEEGIYANYVVKITAPAFYIYTALRGEEEFLSPIHNPIRLLFCALYLLDSVYALSLIYWDNPKNKHQLYKYSLKTRSLFCYRFLLAFAPSLYFSMFSSKYVLFVLVFSHVLTILADMILQDNQEDKLREKILEKCGRKRN